MDTYAYCLLDNHFHICIRIKSGKEILTTARSGDKFKLDRHFVRRYMIPYIKLLHGKTDAADLADLTDLQEQI